MAASHNKGYKLVTIAPVEEAVYLGSHDRFIAMLSYRGRRIECHINDPGSVDDRLRPGVRVLVKPSWRLGRRTKCSIVASVLGDTVVLEDPSLANKVFEKTIPLIYGSAGYEKEAGLAGSRLDYVIVTDEGVRLVEVKATGTVLDGVAFFPGRPSTRASRHLDTLALLAGKGHRVELVFIVLRPDAELVKPNYPVDASFARRLCAYRDRITYRAIRVKNVLTGNTLEIHYAGTIPVKPCI